MVIRASRRRGGVKKELGAGVKREQYREMLTAGNFELSMDQVAVLAAALYSEATAENSIEWDILLGLGLIAFQEQSFKELSFEFRVTPVGYRVLEEMSNLVITRALLSYKDGGGAKPFMGVGFTYMRQLPIDELPGFLVDGDLAISLAAQSICKR